MIRALITGELVADPQSRASKTGSTFAVCRVSVPQADAGRIYCSVIVFDDRAVERLLQLRAGASISVAGTMRLSTYQGKDGTTRPSLDMTADEVCSTTPRPKKPKADDGSIDGRAIGLGRIY